MLYLAKSKKTTATGSPRKVVRSKTIGLPGRRKMKILMKNNKIKVIYLNGRKRKAFKFGR